MFSHPNTRAPTHHPCILPYSWTRAGRLSSVGEPATGLPLPLSADAAAVSVGLKPRRQWPQSPSSVRDAARAAVGGKQGVVAAVQPSSAAIFTW